MIYPDLILNLALLVALSVVSGFIEERWRRQSWSGVLMQGALFGAAAVIGMLRPLNLGPGLIFDGRSVMISLCALFYGPVAALAATSLTLACRIELGGAGTLMGVLVILSSACIGLVARLHIKPESEPPSARSLYLFGVVVHVAMLAMVLALPLDYAVSVMKRIGPPVMLLYPLATVLAGKILSDRVSAARHLTHLQRTRENLDITLQSIGDAVISTDTEGRIALINPVAEALTGWRDGEALGMPLEEVFRIVHEETRVEAESPAARALREGAVVGLANHTVLIARDGTERPIADSGAPIRDEKGAVYGVVLVFRDQTEERAAQKTLRESEERFRSFFDNAPFGKSITLPDGRLLRVNPALCAMLGRTAEEILNSTFAAITHPDDLAESVECMRSLLAGERDSGEMIKRYLTRSGGHVWTHVTTRLLRDEEGRPLYFITHVLDITEHKRAEEALRESELRFRTIYDTIAVGVAQVSLDSRFQRANPAYCRMLGYCEEELIGKGLGEVTHPEVLELNLERQSRLARGELDYYEIEKRYLHKDGRVIHGITRVNLVRDAAGDPAYTIGTVVDITERKLAEAALRESEETHRALVEGLPDVVMRFDCDGRLLFVSRNVEEVFDLPPSTLMGRNCVESDFLGVLRPVWGEALRKVCESGSLYETEFTSESGRGPAVCNLRLLPERDEAGAVRSALAIIRDITAHRRAEQDYRMLFQEMLEGFAVHEIVRDEEGRPVDYRFLAVNPAFERITGLKTKDLTGRTVLEVMPGIEPQWFEIYGKVALTGEPAFFEQHVAALNKRFEVTAFRPAPDQFACIVSDVTERRQAHEERRKLQAQLHQAQKMESIGRLAGGVAHDFNNMLMVILGHVEMALAQAAPGQPLYADLVEIHAAARRSAELTRQLLAFARRQTAAPKVLDLNDTVSGMLKMLRRLIGEDIDLVWKPGADLWQVKIDPSQVDQVLANLCVNSRDAIDGVGRVVIETSNAVFDEAQCAGHADLAPGEYVCLAVSDNGCGMDQKTKEKIFEPFFTTKGLGKGTGLGLAMIYGIVKQNQGFVNIYSEPGEGAVFRIYLPRLAGEAVETVDKGPIDVPRGRGEIVLLVEDEPAILSMGKRMLERLGYRVLTAGAPGEALQLTRERGGEIGLLMTDVVMPEMNGRELAERATAIRPGLKSLFMSGYTADAIAHHGVLDEGVDFLQKPFSWKDLALKVRKAIDE